MSFAPVADFYAMHPTCGLQLIGEFLDDPTTAPTGACVDALPSIRFDAP